MTSRSISAAEAAIATFPAPMTIPSPRTSRTAFQPVAMAISSSPPTLRPLCVCLQVVSDLGKDEIGRVAVSDPTDPDGDAGSPLLGLLEPDHNGVPAGPDAINVPAEVVPNVPGHPYLKVPQGNKCCRPDPVKACKKDPAILRPGFKRLVNHQCRGNARGEQRCQGHHPEQSCCPDELPHGILWSYLPDRLM